jgi:hypothetical protein
MGYYCNPCIGLTQGNQTPELTLRIGPWSRMVAIIGLKMLDSGIIKNLETKRPGTWPGLGLS